MSKGSGKITEGGRQIKQVYLSDDGTEEMSVTSEVIEKGGNGGSEHHPAGHHKRRNRRTVRIICVALVMLFSLILSMCVGVGLALWDSDRTVSELGAIVFAKEAESAETAVPEDAKEAEVADNAEEQEGAVTDDALDDVPQDLPVQDTVTSDTPVPGDQEDEGTDDYGATIASSTDGLTDVSQAGSEDEITGKDEEETGEVKDPVKDYPLPFSTVDESYFTDALFIGDSRLQGFGFWSGLPATFYCATGFQLYKYDTANVVQTENGKVPIFEAMPYDAFTKIYIKVGLNELGYGTEANFEKSYADLIAKLREYEPRAIIYVHALLPVTAEKSATDSAHNNPNIKERNTALKDFAEKQKAYFLDAGPVLSTTDGSLRPEMTTDGIHLKAEYMKIWREYLCEHAIVLR